MANDGQIAEVASWLAAALERAEREPAVAGDVGGALREMAVRFEWLRERYRASPADFGPHVGRLKSLRQRFNALATRAVEAVVDRYHELNLRVQSLEREKETWREVLIAEARSRRGEVLAREAIAQVRTSQSRHVPAAGSDTRWALEQLIADAGCWREVSQLSATKLQTAIARHALPASCASEVERLCPPTQRHTVQVRLRGAPAAR